MMGALGDYWVETADTPDAITTRSREGERGVANNTTY